IFFFFSSRRLHTRFSRDWSSDVCSSDLLAGQEVAVDARRDFGEQGGEGRKRGTSRRPKLGIACDQRERCREKAVERRLRKSSEEIGRASRRERVEVSVGG